MINLGQKLGPSPKIKSGLAIGLTLLIGLLGAGLATLFGAPAPALLGSTFAVSLASFIGLPLKMSNILRNVAFTTIGCSMGAGITPDILDNAAKWPLSLVVLTLLLILIMFVTSQILIRLYGHSKETAVLSSSPGALSFSLALAESGIGNLKVISVLQGLRLLIITLCLPLLLSAVGEEGQFSAGSIPAWLSIGQTLILIAAVYVLGTLGSKIKIPAAYILIGMLLSGSLHASGILVRNMPPDILFVGFTITGAVIGSRFSAISRSDLRGLFVAAFTIFIVSSLLTATTAYVMSGFLGVPFGQIWVAYASGGVEAMAAIALALDYDPAFVATHHLYRMLLLIVMLPILIRFVGINKLTESRE